MSGFRPTYIPRDGRHVSAYQQWLYSGIRWPPFSLLFDIPIFHEEGVSATASRPRVISLAQVAVCMRHSFLGSLNVWHWWLLSYQDGCCIWRKFLRWEMFGLLTHRRGFAYPVLYGIPRRDIIRGEPHLLDLRAKKFTTVRYHFRAMSHIFQSMFAQEAFLDWKSHKQRYRRDDGGKRLKHRKYGHESPRTHQTQP
jgi:hypothetical protein